MERRTYEAGDEEKQKRDVQNIVLDGTRHVWMSWSPVLDARPDLEQLE